MNTRSVDLTDAELDAIRARAAAPLRNPTRDRGVRQAHTDRRRLMAFVDFLIQEYDVPPNPADAEDDE